MSWRFADGIDRVVTTHAVPHNIVVIEICRYPAKRRVTILAGVTTKYVGRMLTRCSRAIVATGAIPEHLQMIDAHDRSEGHNGVTIFAHVCRQSVCRVLADRTNAVVTTHAVAGNVVVIKIRGRPAVGRMAVATRITALDMTNVLARGGAAIVATGAGPEHLQMIDAYHRRERRGRVAVLANIGCHHVGQILAGGAHAVVAGYAVARHTEVIEEDREPAGRPVTGLALLLGRRMIRGLADALHVVVTGRAAAEDGIVIHLGQRKPCRAAMAVLAEIDAGNMVGRFRTCFDPTADRMTANTRRRCSLKNAAHVTRFAVFGQVGAFQAEPRREVIEVGDKARLRPGYHREPQE